MTKKLSLGLLICLLVLSNCENPDAVPDTDAMLFGNFAGHCLGNCFTSFRVDSTAAQSDDSEGHFTFERYEFQNSRALDKNAFTDAKAILNSLPPELLATEKERYGCPDCADQGGYFIIFDNAGERKMVILDAEDTDDQSSEIIAFKQKLQVFIQKYRN